MTRPAYLEVFCFRYPLDTPMQTVFGPVKSRPALVVRIEDNEGAEGWGEIWCNFPQVGAEHRAKLAVDVAPLALADIDTASPGEAFHLIRQRIHRLALQAGEAGPADQIAAGFDIALADLAARRADVPLANYLGGAPRKLRAYASGIDSRLAADMVSRAYDEGYRAFKLRVGFGRRAAVDGVAAARAAIGKDDRLMVDANQNWDVAEAAAMSAALSELSLDWLEEPLPVDRPESEWKRVKRASSIPIAGGENMRSAAEFDAAIHGRVFGVIQPDICKWGGASGIVPIARSAILAGKRYCPHFLGGGIGLAASAHLLAAVGGDGLLEVDCNENPLRDRLAGTLLSSLDGGLLEVPAGPGIGYKPDVGSVKDLLVLHLKTGL